MSAVENDSVDSRDSIESAWEEVEGKDESVDTEVVDADDTVEENEDSTEDATEDSTEGDEEDVDEPEEEEPTDAIETDEEEPESELDLRDAPSSWRKEEADKFGELPDWAQDYISLREDQMHRGLDMYKTDAQKGRELERAFKPFDDYLSQVGYSREQAVSSLLNAEMQLRTGTPEQKAYALQKLANDYGVDLEATSQMAPIDPRYSNLENQMQQLLMNQAQQQHTEQYDNTYEELAAFGAEHQFFDEVRDDMADLIESGKAHTLDEAYDKACRMNDDVFGRMQESAKQQDRQQSIREQAKAASRAKKSATSIKGGPGKTPVEAPKTPRDALEIAFDEAGLN